MAFFDGSHGILLGNAAVQYEALAPSFSRCGRRRPSVCFLALVSGGLLSLQCVMPMEAAAQSDPRILAVPNATAVTADQKSVSSKEIMRDSQTGKSIIIVGGSGRLGSKVVPGPKGIDSLNPQPLPPSGIGYRNTELRKPAIPRGNGVGSLNPQPLPPR